MGDPAAWPASPSPSRWSDLRRRVASAAVLAPVALLCIWFGGAWYAGLIVLAGCMLSLEWVWLCRDEPRRAPGLFVPVSVVLGGVAASFGQPAAGLAILLAGFAAAWVLAGRISVPAGVLYIGIGAVALIWLRQGADDAGRANVLFLVLVVWCSDIGAYAVGRWLGGPRLAPRLSPSKTWAGAGGGLMAAIVAGQFAAGLLSSAPWGKAAVIAGSLGVAAQAGDLLESAIKRHFGVKDSGRLIPGHGGLLDRLDGLLAAAPAAAAWAVIMGRGGFLWQ